MRLWIAAVCMCVFTAAAAAQEDEVIMQPVRDDGVGRARRPTLHDAISAQVIESDGKLQVVFQADAFRDEKVMWQVTKYKKEKKTRKITNAAGEIVEQQYTVVVPIVVEEEVTIRVAAGKKPIAVSIQVCNFYNLDNEGLSDVEAAELLTDSRPVLLLDNYRGRPIELEPHPRALLRPDCLIIATEEVIREANKSAQPPVFLRFGDTMILKQPFYFPTQPNAAAQP